MSKLALFNTRATISNQSKAAFYNSTMILPTAFMYGCYRDALKLTATALIDFHLPLIGLII